MSKGGIEKQLFDIVIHWIQSSSCMQIIICKSQEWKGNAKHFAAAASAHLFYIPTANLFHSLSLWKPSVLWHSRNWNLELSTVTNRSDAAELKEWEVLPSRKKEWKAKIKKILKEWIKRFKRLKKNPRDRTYWRSTVVDLRNKTQLKFDRWRNRGKNEKKLRV